MGLLRKTSKKWKTDSEPMREIGLVIDQVVDQVNHGILDQTIEEFRRDRGMIGCEADRDVYESFLVTSSEANEAGDLVHVFTGQWFFGKQEVGYTTRKMLESPLSRGMKPATEADAKAWVEHKAKYSDRGWRSCGYWRQLRKNTRRINVAISTSPHNRGSSPVPLAA